NFLYRFKFFVSVVVYLNAHCSTGRYLDRTKFLSVRNTRFGPSGVNHVMRACLQMLIDSAHPGDAANVLNCCTSDSSGSGPSLSADSNGSTLMRRLPVFKSQLDAWKYLAQVLDRLQTCPHLLAKRYDSCTACEPAHPSQPLSK
uniref:SLED domain-containing protein n=1 Tax=Romanomermis culicivorax TaxID=13658 RepID=A0A915KN81_ROMCU